MALPHIESFDSGTLRSLLPEVRSPGDRARLLELIDEADMDEYWSARAAEMEEIEQELGID